ncbi:MAG: hypothetical protein SNJ73_10165, partial [Acetobacteraceae bacterium]
FSGLAAGEARAAGARSPRASFVVVGPPGAMLRLAPAATPVPGGTPGALATATAGPGLALPPVGVSPSGVPPVLRPAPPPGPAMLRSIQDAMDRHVR